MNVVDAAWAAVDWTLARALRTARFWWIAVGYFTALFAWYAVQVHQTKYLIEIGFSTREAAWALGAVSLAGVPGQIALGWLSDRIGSRNLFLISTVGFIIASALCGMAQSLEEMVLFRLLQGVSAAFMNPLSQTVMLDINPPERQAKAMSIWGMGIMVGPIMGPVIGGWLMAKHLGLPRRAV